MLRRTRSLHSWTEYQTFKPLRSLAFINARLRFLRRPKARRTARRASTCRKSLAEFAPAGANEVKSVFSRDMMCVAENTSQAASVGLVRHRRTKPARGRLHPSRKSGTPLFRQSQARRTARRAFGAYILTAGEAEEIRPCLTRSGRRPPPDRRPPFPPTRGMECASCRRD